MAASMENTTQNEIIFVRQGAEAKLYSGTFYGRPCYTKERFSKAYRHPSLDQSLTAQRFKAEVRAINRCRSLGISVPSIYFVDFGTNTIHMEEITESQTVRDYIVQTQKDNPETAVKILTPVAEKIGSILGKMHAGKIIHGDLTTSNMLLRGEPENLDIVMIDFGLSFISDSSVEDKGVDLYVFERALLSTHPNTEKLFEMVLKSYQEENKSEAKDVIQKLDEVRMRGRKRTMVG